MTYVISYYNESLAEWTGTGSGAFKTIEHARNEMRRMAKECNHCVSFKIVTLPG